ncbi:MAG: peptidoglycan DD-metalloendopeptidase family protein [bacterium]|nr:peptidoglycan DD-metalloendopeptidase family protein [bacterium]
MQKYVSKLHTISLICFVLVFSTLYFSHVIQAQSIDELQTKINQRSKDIKDLEVEIAKYQKEINALGTQVSSLAATLKSLELTQKKLEADIKITENRVAEKNLEIQKLGGQISDKVETITQNRQIITKSLVTMNEYDTRSVPELLLSQESLSGTWNSLDEIGSIQKALVDRIQDLRKVKAGLEVNKKSTEKARGELLVLNKQLKDQRSVVLGTAAEKNKILKDTKQSESEYQKILAQRRAQKIEFEKELFQFESALHIAIDFGSLPSKGSGVLSWPLDNIFITQQFGVTSASARLYASGSHGGMDLRASIGTPVKAALSGVVTDVERVTQKSGCQYGYWVLVRHANGLSTLYAHLSLVGVNVGQTVGTGQIVGYSGNTGYSEGPHLHFGVYATEGIRIVTADKLNPATSCKGIKTVAADTKAYLDPGAYLPR